MAIRTGSSAATRASLIVCLMLGISSSAAAQRGTAATTDAADNWMTYNRTLAGDRFSPLKEINRATVARLTQLCAYVLPEVSALQTGPLVIDGVMYFTTDTISYAINAATCTEKWRVARHNPKPSMLLVNRGFAYDGGRLFRGTSDSHVLAMDPADGHVIWDRIIDAQGPGVSIPMAPIAANGLVYIGNAGGDQVGVSGHVYAFSERDGHVVWKFDVVPDSGPARKTWTNPRLPIAGGAFWTSFTLDAPNGVLYVPAGNPAPDFDIERRTGDNLYANSVIALDATTGRMLAYNQLVKRDTHDWDVDSPPMLATTRSGRAIVASANKDGLLSILDRSKVTARSAPPGAGGMPYLMPLRSQTPVTTRLNADVPLSRQHVTHFCPGIMGGVEWNGAAYSPQTNSLFVGAVDWCANVQVEADTVPVPAAGALWLSAGNEMATIFDPQAQAKGWVTAFDAESGAVRWKFAGPHPILAGVTPTAGDIVFAADLGGMLYAFDAEKGGVLWQVNLEQSTGGGLVTYRAGGHQLVALASGMKSGQWPGAAAQSRIVVFGLH